MSVSLAGPRPIWDASSQPSHPEAGHLHAVQFCESDAHLTEAVGRFLREGLASDEPLLVIATPEHSEAFLQQLDQLGMARDQVQAARKLTLLDARACLARFMTDDLPDAALFQVAMGEVLGAISAATGRPHIRAYGEMVDLLWRDGNQPGALRLEELWNDLARVHSFSLLCAYMMGNFYRQAHRAAFNQILTLHSHVAPTERFPTAAAREGQDWHISQLQQRAQSLESEVAHRRELETALREALTARRKVEDELRVQNEELARTVRFSEMFVGILGHDLRNPLSAISTAAGFLARRANSEEIGKPAARILRSSERMARMIDQLLDFTSIRVGKGMILERAATDLAEVCRLANDELEGASPQRKVRVTATGEYVGLWDGDRLAQLVSNLVGNALVHGQGEAISVEIDGTQADRVTLEVHNPGTIPAERLATIFEPFESTSNRKQSNSSGLGLGLYISEQIVVAHGGTLRVSSSEAQGTSFVASLPRRARL